VHAELVEAFAIVFHQPASTVSIEVGAVKITAASPFCLRDRVLIVVSRTQFRQIFRSLTFDRSGARIA
jgi:hypothetical protein